MKKILILMTIILMVNLTACKNEEVKFPDFSYTAAYFPYQYPIRTIVLGDYIYDNTNDNNHLFWISAGMGGVYTNTKDRLINIKLDESLCNRVLFSSSSDTIRLMPSNYYTLSSSDKLTIPSGQFNGHIEVHLTDAFFNDPKAIKLNYVIPVSIVSSTDVDSIVWGKLLNSLPVPDRRIASQWSVVPKDYTMFAVKFINPYDGNYLHRGVSVVKDASNNVIENTVYRTTQIEQNEIWRLKTSGRNQIAVQGSMRSTKFSGSINLLLDFTDSGDCTIKQDITSKYTITGTGKFVKNADTWGNQLRNALYLNYQFTDGKNTYSASDTLVVRDRAVVLETYTPTVF